MDKVIYANDWENKFEVFDIRIRLCTNKMYVTEHKIFFEQEEGKNTTKTLQERLNLKLNTCKFCY